jgi:hypothetical protein
VAFSLIKELGNAECLMRESPEELRAAWQRHLLAAIPAMKPE